MILLAEQKKSDLFLRGGVWEVFFLSKIWVTQSGSDYDTPNVSVGTTDAVKICATRLRINGYDCV